MAWIGARSVDLEVETVAQIDRLPGTLLHIQKLHVDDLKEGVEVKAARSLQCQCVGANAAADHVARYQRVGGGDKIVATGRTQHHRDLRAQVIGVHCVPQDGPDLRRGRSHLCASPYT